MNTPTVTMKVTPRELLMIDTALSVFADTILGLSESDFEAIEGYGLERLVKTIKRFALDTAEGQYRPLIHRANTLRKAIDIS